MARSSQPGSGTSPAKSRRLNQQRWNNPLPALRKWELAVLAADDVMKSGVYRLDGFLHGDSARERFRTTPTDRVGVFKKQGLEFFTYKEVLLQFDRLESRARREGKRCQMTNTLLEVYGAYLEIAETEFWKDLQRRNLDDGPLGLIVWVCRQRCSICPAQTIRTEMREYFRSTVSIVTT